MLLQDVLGTDTVRLWRIGKNKVFWFHTVLFNEWVKIPIPAFGEANNSLNCIKWQVYNILFAFLGRGHFYCSIRWNTAQIWLLPHWPKLLRFLTRMSLRQKLSSVHLLPNVSCRIHLLTIERMKQYFSEKNALTVTVSIFCFVMMIIAFVKDHSFWQGIAFALAFSFSIEVICHRSKEVK